MVKKKKIIKNKSVKKKTTTPKPKRVSKPHITQTTAEVKVEKILVENFVSLQKIMTHLSIKLDGLTTQISKLLTLFELSAKALADKNFDPDHTKPKDNKNEKKIMEKLDNLAGQNKVIARGLTMIHEKEPKQFKAPEFRPEPGLTPPTPFKSPQNFEPNPKTKQGYQKSISSENQEIKELEED